MQWKSVAQNLPPQEAGATDDSGALLRLMQLVLSSVDAAGADGCRLTRESAIVAVARALIGEATDQTSVSRTAMMALRDLVWRVDTARGLLIEKVGERARQELELLLDTADVHAFLRSAAPPRPIEPESGEEIIVEG